MSSRMRRPETLTIQITRGDWLLVKKHLTAGEQRAIYSRMMRSDNQLDTLQVGRSKMVGYLLDWSVTDADNKPVVIRDQGHEVVESALDALDMESWKEILGAIEAHEDAMEQERTAEKNALDGAKASSAISPSLSSSAGDMSGSMNLTEMSTR